MSVAAAECLPRPAGHLQQQRPSPAMYGMAAAAEASPVICQRRRAAAHDSCTVASALRQLPACTYLVHRESQCCCGRSDAALSVAHELLRVARTSWLQQRRVARTMVLAGWSQATPGFKAAAVFVGFGHVTIVVTEQLGHFSVEPTYTEQMAHSSSTRMLQNLPRTTATPKAVRKAGAVQRDQCVCQGQHSAYMYGLHSPKQGAP